MVEHEDIWGLQICHCASSLSNQILGDKNAHVLVMLWPKIGSEQKWPKFLTSICRPSVVWRFFPQSVRCESPKWGHRNWKDTSCRAYRQWIEIRLGWSSQLQFFDEHLPFQTKYIILFVIWHWVSTRERIRRVGFLLVVRVPWVSWAQRNCNGKPALFRFMWSLQSRVNRVSHDACMITVMQLHLGDWRIL